MLDVVMLKSFGFIMFSYVFLGRLEAFLAYCCLVASKPALVTPSFVQIRLSDTELSPKMLCIYMYGVETRFAAIGTGWRNTF